MTVLPFLLMAVTDFLQSMIMVVFREDKHLEDEKKAWEFWHSRQHSYKQRVLDIGGFQEFSFPVLVLKQKKENH